MPSAKSGRVAQRRRAIKDPLRSKAKTQIRKARRLISAGDFDSAQEAAREAASALDKAAKKGALHRNNASRRKSRLMGQLQKAISQQG